MCSHEACHHGCLVWVWGDLETHVTGFEDEILGAETSCNLELQEDGYHRH